jgi:hypothetical protein
VVSSASILSIVVFIDRLLWLLCFVYIQNEL